MVDSKINGVLNFQDLLPSDNISLDIYEKALDYVLANDKIKNIAITGSYGSGKSSLMETFEKRHKENMKFLHISLAHFTDIKDSAVMGEEVIEGKILNQLLHKIDASAIPQTRFKIKRDENSTPISKKYIRNILGFSLLAFYTLNFADWNRYVNGLDEFFLKDFLLITTNPYGRLISGAICLYFIYKGLNIVLPYLKNKGVLRKISFKGNEIELFESDDASYFDKYLNEVIYLFDQANADIVIFEDIDRFEQTNIFEKLREICILLNERKRIDKKVKFFYLLRDDMFISKERTKFFDYIIPVIPVVDSSNSFDQFLKLFEEGNIKELFNQNFLRGICLYIDDMRILKNIYNEFLIYFYSLNKIELNSDKMLAIITYKNIFPKDFAELQLNAGFVYALFSNKITLKEAELEEQRAELYRRIEAMQSEHLISVQELDELHVGKKENAGYNSQKEKKIEEWYITEYRDRKKVLQEKCDNGIGKLKDKDNELQQEILKIKNLPLKDLITRENIDIYFKLNGKTELGKELQYEDIKESDYFDLLKYLIRNGFIDESYNDYMTYFYDNSLCREDKIFLRSIMDKKRKDYTYSLKDPRLIVDNLNIMDFDQEETLNYDLLIYLLRTKRKDAIARIISQLKFNRNYEFIEGFIKKNEACSLLIIHISKYWREMFQWILEDKALSEDIIKTISMLYLYHCSQKDLDHVNIDNCLSNYISHNETYLDIKQPNINKLISQFVYLNVDFVRLNYDRSNKELFHEVYQTQLFVSSFENMIQMLEKILCVSPNDLDATKMASLIMKHRDSSLYDYIFSQTNSDYCLRQIIENVNEINDDKEVVVNILNSAFIVNETKESYIELLKTRIDLLEDIEDFNLQTVLIEKKLVAYLPENIFTYYQAAEEISDDFADFINSGNKVLNFDNVKDSHIHIANYDEMILKFFSDSIVSTTLSLKKYEEIIISLAYYYKEFNFKNIETERMNILIKNKTIKMTKSNLMHIRTHYPAVRTEFIKANINEYIDILEPSLVDDEEILDILSWKIEDDKKIKILANTNSPYSILEMDYSEMLCQYILAHNLDENDLPSLFKHYDNYSDEIKALILKLACQYIDLISIDPHELSNHLLLQVLSSSELKQSDIILVIINMISGIHLAQLKDLLKAGHLYEFLKLFEFNSRPAILKNSNNESLLMALGENGFIESFEDNTNKMGYYKVKKKRHLLK